MKKKGHPPYQEVLFIDSATGHKFICGSTIQPKETEEFEGKKYPVYRMPISSASHPFFTKSQQFVDAEGRVDKFRKRYTAKQVAPVAAASSDQEKKSGAAPKKAAAKSSAAKKKATS